MRLLIPVVLALVLVACGSDEPETTAAAEGATVTHKFGETKVPADPKRVVTVGWTDQDAVLALGVTPVAVANFGGGYEWKKRPWAQDALKGADPEVVVDQQINFEAVAAQRPDLIIAVNAGLKQADYDKLSRIAPTVAQSGDYIDFGMPWDEQTLLIGQALGREDQAEQLVADVKVQFEAFRAKHPEFAGQTAILAYGGPDGYGAYATGDTRSRFLTDLGFSIPKEIDDLAGDSFYTQFSQEQFRLMDQDVVVMYGAQEDILADPVFKRLKAVKEDRVIYLDLTDQMAGALGFASALSLPWLLENTEQQFVAAADGDPATKIEQPE
jgi:iron complex transport system substrate-binding protein